MGVIEFLMSLAVGAGVLFAILFAIAVVAEIVLAIARRRGNRTSVADRTPAPPEPRAWSLSLIVDVDEEHRVFRPSVQLRGPPLPSPATISLRLVDPTGHIRQEVGRSLPPWAIGAELSLPAFGISADETLDEALGWHWDLVVEDERGERARWREHPKAVGGLNPELELGIPDPSDGACL